MVDVTVKTLTANATANMKIEKANDIAALIKLLWKLDLISYSKADHLIDILTVRCLQNPDDIYNEGD